ncbi:MAG: hypothetical protein HKN05_13700, partial [Rhizobiales bacterium]|nr:hypothetical protein [Hyphomicrobiales bacterium]
MAIPGISFQTIDPATAPDPNRMDIALFAGFVPLRQRNVPAAVRRQLAETGWDFRLSDTNGELIDVPVRLDSLSEFVNVFDGAARPDRIAHITSLALPEEVTVENDAVDVTVVVDGHVVHLQLPAGTLPRDEVRARLATALDGLVVVSFVEEADATFLRLERADRTTAGHITIYLNPAIGFPRSSTDRTQLVGCPLAAVVGAFFAAGGKTCYVVRLGDPLPLNASEAERVQQLSTLLTGEEGAWPAARFISDLIGLRPRPPASASADRTDWHGLGVLNGLEDVSFVSLPDLPDLLASGAPGYGTADPVRGVPEIFQECSEASDVALDGSSHLLTPPRSDSVGLTVWWTVVKWLASSLRRTSFEHMAVLSLPLPDDTINDAYSDFLDDLFTREPFENPAHDPQFAQVVFPWLKGAGAETLPGGIMPGEGYFCGAAGRAALERGVYRTVAGRPAPQVAGLVPSDASGLNRDMGPGRRLSLFGAGIGGTQISSDVTLSEDPDWHPAAVKRLMAMIFRAARHKGELSTFEPSSPRLWRDIERNIGGILRQVYLGGGLRGAREEDAFSVTCDMTTMT